MNDTIIRDTILNATRSLTLACLPPAGVGLFREVVPSVFWWRSSPVGFASLPTLSHGAVVVIGTVSSEVLNLLV